MRDKGVFVEMHHTADTTEAIIAALLKTELEEYEDRQEKRRQAERAQWRIWPLPPDSGAPYNRTSRCRSAKPGASR